MRDEARTEGRERAGEPSPPMGGSQTQPVLLFGSSVALLIWETLSGQPVSVGEVLRPKIRAHSPTRSGV